LLYIFAAVCVPSRQGECLTV